MTRIKRAFGNWFHFLKGRLRTGLAVSIISAVFILFCIGSAIYFAVSGKTQNTLMSLVFPLIVVLAYILEYNLKMRLMPLFCVVFYIMCTSNICGNGYGMYEMGFNFDKIMHTLSGIVFTCLGYALMKLAMRGDGGNKIVACLIGAFCFCMATAAVWEIYEYFVSEVLHDDMQGNQIVYTIDYIKEVEKTIIYYTDGTSEVVEGYIDIGLFDTLGDMTVCFFGSLVTIAVLAAERAFGKDLFNRLLVPVVLSVDGDRADEQVAACIRS